MDIKLTQLIEKKTVEVTVSLQEEQGVQPITARSPPPPNVRSDQIDFPLQRSSSTNPNAKSVPQLLALPYNHLLRFNVTQAQMIEELLGRDKDYLRAPYGEGSDKHRQAHMLNPKRREELATKHPSAS